MNEPHVAPYGTWPSPITAQDVAKGSTHLEFPGFADTGDGEQIWWVEGRPQAGGRHALVARGTDGRTFDVLEPEWSPRSRIIEYGARPWIHLRDRGVVFTFWDDQRLYLCPVGEQPQPLTVAPTEQVSHMYGEPVGSPDGTGVWVVRETHRGDQIERTIVSVPLDGSAANDDDAVRVIASGHRFFGYPRPAPDGQHLAYIAWDHPQMPWDGTLLYVADLAGDVATNPRVLAGSPTESVMQPEWADVDRLYAISDRSGWWNLYRFDVMGNEAIAIAPRSEEFSQPLWLLGFTSYGVLDDGRLAVLHGMGEQRLAILDPATGSLQDVAGGLQFSEELQVSGSRVVSTAGDMTREEGITLVDVVAGTVDLLRPSNVLDIDPKYLPTAYPLTVDGTDGPIHSWVYPPRNPAVRAPDGERPPYLAFVHGGPTAHVGPVLTFTKAYFTSRGIGVIDVNYGGSSGYGREYRERLREQWGVVDVVDTVAAVNGLVAEGAADGARLGIRGGSAGGWTTLAALVFADSFAAGAAYFPVTDLLPFAEDTHDFESRYLDGLVGPLPQERERYVERSPMSHLDDLHVPVLLLQGDDDKIVPPSQPAAVAAELKRQGIPHKYLLFAGEQHGFRMAQNIATALESELAFFGQVFGFTPPDVPAITLD
jgi:dipeptidyl aminopeptidase/acylaminoacyl peptidase